MSKQDQIIETKDRIIAYARLWDRSGLAKHLLSMSECIEQLEELEASPESPAASSAIPDHEQLREEQAQ